MNSIRLSGFVLFFALFGLTATSFAEGYQPWQFTCTYDASTDGLITATSKIDPDNDAWPFFLKSSKGNEVAQLEATSAYVYGKTEQVDDETQQAISRFLVLLKIDQAIWYTTTDITVPLGGTAMRFFKFNSENGTLGIGVYVNWNGQKNFQKCF